MIIHDGARYWTTDDIAASLVARGIIGAEGSRRAVRRRAERWARSRGFRPTARTIRGGYLWDHDALATWFDLTKVGR